MIRTALTMIVACAAGMSVMAATAEHVIGQKGRAFSATILTIRAGDTVVFANDDNVPHNIMSTSKGNEFDLESQAPGTSIPVTFTSAGEVNVLCVIHPRMYMTIKVTE